MRIENAINEIQGPQQPERRQAAEARRKGSSGRAGDVVEISNTSRSLGAQLNADLSAVNDVRQARVDAVRQRVAAGYYDQPEVRQAIADAMLSSGAIDGVAQEVQKARTAKQDLGNVPDTRADRVDQARQRASSGYYDSAGVRGQIADSILNQWVG